MSPPKVKHVGRIPGTPAVMLPRSDYGAAALLSDFGWWQHDIGALWGVRPQTIYKAVRKWKEDTWREGGRKISYVGNTKNIGWYSDELVSADREEILRYIQSHPGCRGFDIELECHQTRSTTNHRVAELIEAGLVERLNGKYFFDSIDNNC